MKETKSSRKYCCSNHTPFEAVNAATLDLILSLIGIISSLILTLYHYAYPEKLKGAPKELGPIRKFITLEVGTQQTILAIILVVFTTKLMVSGILLFSSIYQNAVLLKLWLLSSIPIGLPPCVVGFLLAFYAKEKLIIGIVALTYFFFQIYTFWIVKRYLVELTTVGTDIGTLETELSNTSETLQATSIEMNT